METTNAAPENVLQPKVHLTGKVIADIYQGTITMWNDPAIQNLNPTITLPAQTINTVHRSDGSGTTFIFTGYLSASSTSWNTAVGQGKSVAWPVGTGSNGNTGVASTVNGTQYAIGYVELAYVLQNGLTVAATPSRSATLCRSSPKRGRPWWERRDRSSRRISE